MAFGNLINQNPFLSKIQKVFGQQQTPQQPQPGVLMPSLPMPQQQQPEQAQQNSGMDLFSMLLKNDTNKSGLLAKIASLFGG